MIVYGKNVARQLQDDPDAIQEVYLQNGFSDAKVDKALKQLKPAQIKKVTKAALDRLTNGGVHQGIACKVKEIETFTLEQLLARKKNEKGFYIALDEIQDPHNVGAILRTADCAGADGVILCRHNAAGLTPAAIKASTGAAYTVPVAIVNNLSQALKKMKEEGYWVAGTGFENARDYRQGMYEEPTVLVIGNEGKGISPLVFKQCDYVVKLPMLGAISSLNASVAAGILMYEVLNKRGSLNEPL